MGSQATKPSNKNMVDELVKNRYVYSANVEGAFRAVDRAMYFEIEDDETVDPYDDDPWRRGNLHLSAPCIYAKVVEALDLQPGLSFLNLGSGTGYLNTIVGLLVGPNGTNHGLEFHSDVVEYAYKRLQEFKLQTYAIDKFEFSEPTFIQGNCINLNPNSKYDRIYLGAACLPELESFMKKLVKPNGGVLVMPYEGSLMRYLRISETNWESEKLMDVNFTLMIRQVDDVPATIIDMPFARVKSLKELCRTFIRQGLRAKVNTMNPELLHSDNSESRQARKERAKAMQEADLEDKLNSFDSKHLRPRAARPRRKHLDRCTCKRDRARPERLISEQALSSSHDTPAEPTPSVSGIMTRSVSRRLNRRNSFAPIPQSSSTSLPLPPLAPKTTLTVASSSSAVNSKTAHQESGANSSNNFHDQPSSSKDVSLSENNLDASNRSDSDRSLDDTLASSDSDDDFGPNSSSRNNYDESLNCARTRPFVYTVRNRSSSLSAHLPTCIRYTCDRFMGRPAFLQRSIARIIDQSTSTSPSSSSSSSSSSPSPSMSDLSYSRAIEEYDNFRGQVVLDWPGFILQNQLRSASIHYPFTNSASSSESDSTNNFRLDFDEATSNPPSLDQRQSPPPPERQQQEQQYKTRSDCKRKRQSSSESSEASNPSSPIRRSQPSCRIGIEKCPCIQLKLIETDKVGKDGTTTANINAASCEQSSNSGGQMTSIASTVHASSSRASPSPSSSSYSSHHHHHHHRHHHYHHHHQKSSRHPITACTSSKQSSSKDSSCSRTRFSSGSVGPSSSTLATQVHHHHPIPLPNNDNFVPDPTARCGSRGNPLCGSFWEPLPCGRSADGRYIFRSAPRGYYSRNPEIASQQASEALARVRAKHKQEREAKRAEEAERRHKELKKRRRKRGGGRGANECERYYSHISGYIRQLPLPRTLHSYLNYERSL